MKQSYTCTKNVFSHFFQVLFIGLLLLCNSNLLANSLSNNFIPHKERAGVPEKKRENTRAATAEQTLTCTPVSTLECGDIVQPLPIALDFMASIPNTLMDSQGAGTGFTAVLEHSEARRNGDLPVSNPEVNGYEPSLLTSANGVLELTSQAGINYQNPPESSNNNNQVNTLGVGLQDLNRPFVIETKLINITTGAGSAQAGIWFGIDEDNFIKLNVSDNSVELRKEVGGVSINGNASPDQILLENTGVSGQNVKLKMRVDPIEKTITAFYAINDGIYTQLSKSTFSEMALPQTYLEGRTLNNTIDQVSFAGVYASHRNGNQFTARFDSFSTTQEALALSFVPEKLDFKIVEGAESTSQTVSISATSGNPSFSLSDDPNAAEWLILPTQPELGNLEFNIQPNLSVGTYSTTVFAIPDDNSYQTAQLEINLEVSNTPLPGDGFALIEDFDTYGIGNLHEIANGSWSKEGINDAVIPVVAKGLTSATHFSLDFSGGQQTHDFETVINDPRKLVAGEAFYFSSYFNVSALGINDTDRIRTALRIDDEVEGEQWIREQIAYGNGKELIARIGLGEPGSDQGFVNITPGQTIQFITRGVWDGANTITYSWSINPGLNETDTQWMPAGTHQVEGEPQVGRIFIGSNGDNNGRIGALRLATHYNKVVTEFLGEQEPARISLSTNKVVGDAISGSANPYIENITLNNEGASRITELTATITGTNAEAFSINALPATIEAGEKLSFNVNFEPTTKGPHYATLNLSAPGMEDNMISLNGLGKSGTGGDKEPSLQWVLDTQLGNGLINVGDNNPATNKIDLTEANYNKTYGDELSITQFEKAASGPVRLEVLSVFGPEENNPITAFGWYASGDASSMNEVFSISNSQNGNGQTLNPVITGETNFDPGTERFGFYSRWPYFNNRVLRSEDALNSFAGAIPHHVRVYALPGENDAYVIAMEEHVSGFDYQDVVVIAHNIRPAGEALAGCNPISTLDCDFLKVNLPFELNFNGEAGGLSNTGFTMVDNPSSRIAADGPITYTDVPGYEPGRITLAEGKMILDAAKGLAFTKNGTGTGTSTDVNAQINSLGVGVDMSRSRNLDVKTTLVQPYNDASQNYEQAGLWFGLNEDNYVKLVVINGSSIQLLTEVAGVSNEDTQNIQLDNITGLHSGNVRLRLNLDTSSNRLTGYYTINEGAEIPVGSLPLPAAFVAGNRDYNALSFAGIFASKRREAAATTVKYSFDNFEVSSEEAPELSFEPVNINFSDPASVAPAGYIKDSGNPYANQGNGYTYGWLNAETNEVADLSLNGRTRSSAGVSVFKNTLIHMQYGDVATDPSGGYLPDAKWEMEVPNGTYTVSVQVGDPDVDGSIEDTPKHTINVEGTPLINQFVPTGAQGQASRFTSAKTTVVVRDGKLTLDPLGGFNTKINSATIAQVASREVPYFTGANPKDGTIDVAVSGFQIAVEVVTPDGYELDKNTTSKAHLYEVTSGGELIVPTNSNDTGGGDAIILTPLSDLRENTTYVLRLPSTIEANKVGDIEDRIAFESFETRFTTGNADSTINQPGRDLSGVSFTPIRGEALGERVQYERFSSMQVGPDGKLYASTIGDFQSDGKIFRWNMEADGTLSNLQVISPELTGAVNPESGSPQNNDTRLIIGFRFDPRATADNLVAYVTHSKSSESDGPEWDGKLTRLSGPNFENVQDIIIHLPRSKKDHLTNSIAFDPAGDLYISQGSNTAGGEPDAAWAFRPERLLSGAILKVALDKLPSNLPLDAYTTDDIDVINNAPTNSLTMSDGTYNPYAVNSPLTIFATGIRNAYDLVWHSNGWLYVPTNGTAGNNRNSPNTPGTANYKLAKRIDGRTSIPEVPALFGGPTQKDWLFKTKGGTYHGHPNPFRGEFVLNHGGVSYSDIPGQVQSSFRDVPKYPSTVQPDPNYIQPAFDFDFNKSPNGAIEYKSDAFGGKLRGLLMVVQFSGQDNLLLLDPGTNGDIAYNYNSVPGLGGFDDPIEVVEDPKTGNLYVSEYDRDGSSLPQLTLLRASDPAKPKAVIAASSNSLLFETTINKSSVQKLAKKLTITNEGSENLVISKATITGEFADQFESFSIQEQLVASGEQVEYTITYAPDLDQSNIGYQSAQLLIESNDEQTPLLTINLDALKKRGFEGNSEPNLQDVVNALGIGIDVGWDSLANGVDPNPVGDEVEVERWVKLNSDIPITITPVGRYSPAEALPFGWYTNDGDIIPQEIGTIKEDLANAQTLYPATVSGEKTIDFDPQGAVFGFYVESKSFGRFNYTEDKINTDGVAHRSRIYPNKNRNGEIIPNSYLITFEDASNGDYQDYMFIMDNVVPFDDAMLAYTFDKEQLDFTASANSETVLKQQVNLTVSGPVSAAETKLDATEDWLILPEDFELGTPFDVEIDAEGLPIGDYEATITASAPNYTGASIDIRLKITNEAVYVYQFNFQSPEDIAVSPEGYVDDTGKAYGPQDTDLGVVDYGWVLPGTTTPASAVESARNRNTGTNDDPLLKTFNIIGHREAGLYPLRDWVVNLPNGSYFVNISVGEEEYRDSNHVLDVNGVTVIDFDQENNNPENLIYKEGTELVEVTDGILRLSLNERGVNAKPNYIRIAPVNISTLPPNIVTTFDGLLFDENTYRGGVDISLSGEDRSASGAIVRIEYTLDDMPINSYSEAISVTEIGTHNLYIEVEDANGNVAMKTVTFTIQEPTGALLAMENMTKIPGTDRGFPADDYFTFYRIGNPNTSGGAPNTALTHDTNTMRINNNGTGVLEISDIAVSDTKDYTFNIISNVGETSMPLSIAPGGHVDLQLRIIASTSNGRSELFKESITITSNADNGGKAIATLNGGFAPQPEGGDEITAQEVFEAFGFTSSMRSIVNDEGTITPKNTTPTRPGSNYPKAENIDAGYEGDLILSSNFVQADKSKPVLGMQLSALHGKGADNGRFVQVNGTGTVGGMDFRHTNSYYQTLLPQRGGAINADKANSIDGPFRIAIANYLTSGGNDLNGTRPDLLGARVYKAKDRDGNIIPNEYIVLQDFIQNGCGAGSANCDWNDNTFYFINIRPEAEPSAQPIDAYAINSGNVFKNDISAYFDNGYAGNKLTYTATFADGSELPEWVTIDEEGMLSGTAPNDAESSYTLKVTATDLNGLTVSENAILNVNTPPVAVITANVTTGPAPLEVQFSSKNSTDEGELLTYAWDFGDGSTSEEANPTHIFEEIADYEVELTLTDEQGLSATDTLTISTTENFAPVAVASADAQEGQAPFEVLFDASASSDDLAIIRYEWDFGNGVISDEINPSYIYEEAGVYEVILRVYDAEGLSGTDTLSITVEENAVPVAVIGGGPFTGNTPLDVFFIGSNSSDDKGIVSYEWDFGDGSFSYENDPTHRYNTAGTYLVELSVYDAAGLQSLARKEVQVNSLGGGAIAPVAIANANVIEGVSPLQVSFDGSQSNDDEAIVSYNWSIDEMTVANTADFNYTFTQAGSYNVNLEVTDAAGLSDQTSVTITVNEAEGTEDFAMYINAGSSTDVNYENHTFLADADMPEIYNSDYTFTDPNTPITSLFKTERGPKTSKGSFSYNIPVPDGTYTVSTYHGELWWGKGGGTATAGKRVFDILIEGELVKDNFDIFKESNNAPTKLTFYNIEVTDGSLTISLPASVDKSSISGIAIMGTVKNDAPVAQASATPLQGEAPLLVQFTGSDSTDDDEIADYLWSFGDGSTSAEINPSHIYDQAGVYPVSLTVTDSDGLTNTVSDLAITVSESEEAQDVAIYLNTGSSASVNYQGRTFVGDVSRSDLYNSNHTYANTGASDVTLYQTERGSAENLTTLSYAIPVANGTYRVQTYHNELWWGKGRAGGAGKRLFDIIIEGSVKRTNFDLYKESNNTPVRLDFNTIIVTDGVLNIDLPASADRASISGLAIESVVNQKPEAIALATPQSGDAPLLVAFDGTTSKDDDGISSYLWEFEQGITSTKAKPTYTFMKSGNYEVKLSVTDAAGLSDQTSVTITVNEAEGTDDFAMYINAGSSTDVNYENHTFLADADMPEIYNSDYTFTDPNAPVTSLFKTERGPKTSKGSFSYNIPVPDGTYTVSTYHGELWWGKGGDAATAGKRVFDILIEGELVKDNFDIFKESNNAPTKLTFYDIEVTDGSLTISLPASVDKSSISGIAITGTGTNAAPEAVVSATPKIGEAPLEVSFNSDGSSDDKEIAEYLWNFDDGSTSNLKNPKHLFTSAGSYEVTLTVTDSEGLSDTGAVVINATGCNPVPQPWTSIDIGAVNATGTTCYSNGEFNVTASGADIWSTRDEFHYAYRTLSGDGEIVAQVNAISNVENWTKAGVMMRESNAVGAKHAFMILAPDPTYSGDGNYGYAFQNRNSTDAVTNSNSPEILPNKQLPYYVRLVRRGNVFTGYISQTNGNWKQVSSAIISMNETINVGLATTSHKDGTLAEAVYSNVQVINYNQLQAITAAPGNGQAPLEVDFSNVEDEDYTEASLSYYWEFQDGETSTEVQPKHTFENAGHYQVSLTVLKNSKVLYQNTVDVDVEGDDFQAEHKDSTIENMEVRLYPNPAQSYVTLEMPETQNIGTITIFDISGRIVKEFDAGKFKNGTRYKLDIESLDAGVYLVYIAGEEGTISKQRLIVEY